MDGGSTLHRKGDTMTESNQTNRLADRYFDKSTILWANTTIIPPFTAGTGKLDSHLGANLQCNLGSKMQCKLSSFLISTFELCRL